MEKNNSSPRTEYSPPKGHQLKDVKQTYQDSQVELFFYCV
jgi:hypothetical protein